VFDVLGILVLFHDGDSESRGPYGVLRIVGYPGDYLQGGGVCNVAKTYIYTVNLQDSNLNS